MQYPKPNPKPIISFPYNPNPLIRNVRPQPLVNSQGRHQPALPLHHQLLALSLQDQAGQGGESHYLTVSLGSGLRTSDIPQIQIQIHAGRLLQTGAGGEAAANGIKRARPLVSRCTTVVPLDNFSSAA